LDQNDAVLTHMSVVAVQEEMDVATRVLQSRAVKPAKRPRADDGRNFLACRESYHTKRADVSQIARRFWLFSR